MRIIRAVIGFIVILILSCILFVYLAPEKATAMAIGLERKLAGLSFKEIDLPGGLHYAYLEGGQGEPLMLLHGFGADKDNFVRVARFLTNRYRVIIPDNLGFGESGHPADADYRPGAQAARLRNLALALGITKVHLGGSSMGGHISMMYAAMYPDEVQSLWLLDPGGIWSAPPGELQKVIAQGGENPLMAKSEDDFARIFAFVMSKPPFIPRPMLNVMAKERIRNYNLEKRIFKELSDDSIEKHVAGLKTPALIVWGENDRVISAATAGVLHNLMPESRVIIMPGVGHLPMIEEPDRTAGDYLKFRDGLK
ncbi:MAG TPA: alpha/beta hydrolase [Desulfomonilia bacterium]